MQQKYSQRYTYNEISLFLYCTEPRFILNSLTLFYVVIINKVIYPQFELIS
jgi:hypothetical protein